MVFLKEFLGKGNFEKNQQKTKSMKNYPVGKELTLFKYNIRFVFMYSKTCVKQPNAKKTENWFSRPISA